MNHLLKQTFLNHTEKMSDKWTFYINEWDRIFSPYHDLPINLFENGIQNGGSLEIWAKYFTNAKNIIGCDIDEKCRELSFTDPRIALFVGDANSDEIQKQVLDSAPKYDIIIDDGSHRSSDVIRSFCRYYPHIEYDGIYVIEDLHTSYWEEFEGSLFNPGSSMSFLKHLADVVNHEHWRNNQSRAEFLSEFSKTLEISFSEADLLSIHSIDFVNSLCILKKCRPDENVLGRRIVVGSEELVTNVLAKLDGTHIQDFSMAIEDDSELSVNNLVKKLETTKRSIEILTSDLGKGLEEKKRVTGVLSENLVERDQALEKNDFLSFKELIINEIKETKDLLILDTSFPHPVSSFRYQEFTSLLENFSNSVVLTTGEDLNALREYRPLEEVIKEFESVRPDLAGRTVATSHDISPNVGYLAYVVFQYNMMVFLAALEMSQIPFIFTLYPGGSFEVNVPESDSVLKRIFDSPLFRKVIVTQKLTYDYLIRKAFCNPDQIEFIYGVVTPIEMLEKPIVKKYYGVDKNTLDICFVAHKYMAKGIDKGYDVFIEVAKNIVNLYDDVNFHVVGSFDESDIPIEGLEGRITFYGLKNSEWLCEFYQNQDVILSPNIPFVVHNGSFDGFPTASCTEAGANGVVILCSDPLGLNIKFTDWEDIVLIPHDAEKITEIISRLRADPGKIVEISKNSVIKIREIYSYENQILPRINLIQSQLDKEKAT